MRSPWVAVFLLPALAGAQNGPASAVVKQIGRDWWTDQKVIWTRPFHITKRQAATLIPFAAVTAALIATDRHTSGALPNSPEQIHVSRSVSDVGAGAVALVGAGLFAYGRIAHESRAAEAGFLSAEAAADAFTVVELVKLATDRQRPYQENGHGRFWADGNSFPSSHSMFSWSVAEVIAEEYHDRPLVRIGAYGLAAVVSAARFPARQHFLSDVVTGSVAGFLIGRHVVNSRHGGGHSWLRAPAVGAHADPRTRTYALRLSWSPRSR